MQSLTAHSQIPASNHFVSRLEDRLRPTLISACKLNNLDKKRHKALFLGLGLIEGRQAIKLGRNIDNSWCRGAKKGEADGELEAEIMDFMAKSEKPTMFPTKKELMRAGRLDLVLAIKKKGGWYSLGWDVENVRRDADKTMDSDIAEFQRRIECCMRSDSSTFPEDVVTSTSPNLDSLQLPASHSSDSSQQVAADEGSGIDGMLSRLEKQRNNDFLAIKLAKKGYEFQSKSEYKGDHMHSDTTSGNGGTDLEENSRVMTVDHPKGMSNPSGGNISHYTEQETWRSWINRRSNIAGFEVGEISYKRDPVDTNKESYHDGISVTTKEYAADMDRHKEINYSEIRARLQGLESELTTALQSIRSKGGNSIPEEVTGSSGELQNLSDALEFQENEVMSAKQKLRSLRAKLAIVEGKMTLAIIDRRKVTEMKQKQFNDARKSLQLLRTTCIMWVTSATEVFLAGSFDGWTTQRRMHRSKSGVFSITLRLYPGRYEIKFIVDGQWKADPLRPIVNNNGHQNNLFTVT